MNELLQKNEFGLVAEIYTGEEAAVNRLGFKSIEVTAATDVSLLEIHPNPVTDEALVVFSLNEPAKVDLQFYNSSGALVMTMKANGSSGINRVSLSGQDLPNSKGLIICQLKTDSEVRVQKFILMNE